MNKTLRTKTTLVSHEVVVIRRPREIGRVFCPECSERVALVTLDEAVRISGISSRAVYRLLEEGRIHFAETAVGVALICPATLLGQVRKK